MAISLLPRLGYAKGIACVATIAALFALPYVADPYQVIIVSYGLIMAIAGLGFNLLLGYTGLLSFGHSAFFGVGAYTAGLMVKYLRVSSMEAFLAGSLAATVIISALFGLICVGHTRIFFAILTLALSQVLWSLALKFFWVTGGTDGLRVPTPSLLGGLVGRSMSKVNFLANVYYYYVLVIILVCVALMWVIVNSPFGKALQAIRDNEIRAEFVGVRVRRSRWIAFAISGSFTGLAGALWAPLNGLTTPETLYWPFSGEIVFLTVLGGFKTFTGPIVGAIVFTYLKTYAVAFTTYWQLLLGAVLVAFVIVMPTGIVGAAARVINKVWRTA